MRFSVSALTLIISLLAGPALLSGCRLFSPGDRAAGMSEVPTEDERKVRALRDFRRTEEAALARECPPVSALCTKADAPVFCQVRSYGNRILKFHEQFAVHADSACHARTQIYKSACQARMVPSLLGTMQCVPDGSAGQCPAEDKECPEDQRHSICVVEKYGEQVLSRKPGLFARGLGECDARNNLAHAICRNNLNPTLATTVRCEPDETGGECLNLKHICRDERKKTWCRASLIDVKAPSQSGQMIEVEGESRCEAMMALHREACARQMKPSRLDEIICKFEK